MKSDCKLMYFGGRHVKTDGVIAGPLYRAFDEVAGRWGVTGDVLVTRGGSSLRFSGDINNLHEQEFRKVLVRSLFQ